MCEPAGQGSWCEVEQEWRPGIPGVDGVSPGLSLKRVRTGFRIPEAPPVCGVSPQSPTWIRVSSQLGKLDDRAPRVWRKRESGAEGPAASHTTRRECPWIELWICLAVARSERCALRSRAPDSWWGTRLLERNYLEGECVRMQVGVGKEGERGRQRIPSRHRAERGARHGA